MPTYARFGHRVFRLVITGAVLLAALRAIVAGGA
jgi:hypothetical protein